MVKRQIYNNSEKGTKTSVALPTIIANSEFMQLQFWTMYLSDLHVVTKFVRCHMLLTAIQTILKSAYIFLQYTTTIWTGTILTHWLIPCGQEMVPMTDLSSFRLILQLLVTVSLASYLGWWLGVPHKRVKDMHDH